jgi:anti-anti-sigma regulatory factor
MGKILFAEQDGIHVLKFEGDVRLSLGPTISGFLEQIKTSTDFRSLIVDLSDAVAIDSTALGLIAKVGIFCREHFDLAPSIVSPGEDITRLLESMAMQEVYMISRDPISSLELIELPQEMASEDDMRVQVLEAHKTLMSLNESNRDKFRDLVEALEFERRSRQKKVAKAS